MFCFYPSKTEIQALHLLLFPFFFGSTNNTPWKGQVLVFPLSSEGQEQLNSGMCTWMCSWHIPCVLQHILSAAGRGSPAAPPSPSPHCLIPRIPNSFKALHYGASFPRRWESPSAPRREEPQVHHTPKTHTRTCSRSIPPA